MTIFDPAGFYAVVSQAFGANVDFIKGLDLRTVDLSGNNITSVRGVAENRYSDGSRSVDLCANCIDLTSENPFTQELVAPGSGVQLEPHRADCSFEALVR